MSAWCSISNFSFNAIPAYRFYCPEACKKQIKGRNTLCRLAECNRIKIHNLHQAVGMRFESFPCFRI